MKFILLFLLGFLALADAQDVPSDPSASPPAPPSMDKDAPVNILNRVQATYKSMATYCSNGTIFSEKTEGETKIQTTTNFTLNLKKPDLYVITWSQTSIPQALPQGGAVWNDGKQRYLYLLMNKTYSKIDDDIAALGAANSVSGGASNTIPSLFFPAFTDKGFGFARLRNPVLEKTDFIGGEECYVVSAPSNTSKKETFWISKSSNLILKYEKSLEPPAGGTVMPEVTEEIIDKAIRAMGQPVTEENKKQVRDMMQTAKGAMNNSDVTGTSTEMQMEITNPNFKTTDFHYTPPLDTTLTDSIMGPQPEAPPPTPPLTNSGSGSAPALPPSPPQ